MLVVTRARVLWPWSKQYCGLSGLRVAGLLGECTEPFRALQDLKSVSGAKEPIGVYRV